MADGETRYYCAGCDRISAEPDCIMCGGSLPELEQFPDGKPSKPKRKRAPRTPKGKP